jgi:hypothetical protein
MTQWLANASPIVSYLIGIPAIMVGSILFLGAFFLKPTRTQRPSILPSMSDQVETIPPPYVAKDYRSFRARLGTVAKKLKQRGRPTFFLGFARVRHTSEKRQP